MLLLRARIRPSVYRKTDARTRKNRFDEREQDWVVQKFGLRRLQQRFEAIQAEPPFHLLTQEDKGRLYSQNEKKDARERLCKIRSLLSMRGMLLGYSLGLIAEHLLLRARLWPSVYQIAGTRTRINLFDKRWLVQRFELRWLQRFDVIQVEPPFLLLTRKDKRRRLYSQGDLTFARRSLFFLAKTCRSLFVFSYCLFGFFPNVKDCLRVFQS